MDLAAWEVRRDEELGRYEQYLHDELPRQVRRRLREEVDFLSEPVLGQLRARMVDIVRDAQSDLFRNYRQASQLRENPTNRDVNSSDAGVDCSLADNDFLELEANLDISAYYVPPLVPNTYTNPSLEDTSDSVPCLNQNIRPNSDSGYGSNNVSFGQVQETSTGSDSHSAHLRVDVNVGLEGQVELQQANATQRSENWWEQLPPFV